MEDVAVNTLESVDEALSPPPLKCIICREKLGEGRLYFSEKLILDETVCADCARRLGGEVEK